MPLTSLRQTFALLACLGAVLTVSPRARAAGLATKQACVAASEQGQELRSAGKLAGARDAFIRCAGDVCPKLVRVDCGEQLAQVDRELPTIAFDFVTAEGQDLAGVAVTVDANAAVVRAGAPLKLDPGKHSFVFTAAGLPPVTRDFVLVQGTQNRHERIMIVEARPTPPASALTPPAARPSPPPPPPPSSSIRFGSWLAFGVAVAQLGAASTLLALSANRFHSLETMCDGSCAPSRASGGRTESVVADVLFATGGATLAGSIVWWLVPSHPPAADSMKRVGISLAPGSVLLEGAF